MKRRRGFTLIELLVTISLFAIILPAGGWTVYLLLRAQTASANSLADSLTLSRFARTFHDDVHAARSAELKGDRTQDRAIFKLDSSRAISYAADRDGVIVRTVQNGAQIERREEFRLAGTQTRFEFDAEREIVAAVHKPRTFTISGGPGAAAGTSTIRIAAVIGRDRRLQHSSSGPPSEPPPPALPMRPAKEGKRP